ncbi:MAG: DUF354 domain-containing protein [bacterium]
MKKIKIWIDLTNSPHINFFKPFVNNWKKEGFELIITCRDLSNTIQLIQQNGWDYKVIGKHAGKKKIKKLLHFPIRSLELLNYLKKKRPDIGISHSSFYSPIVASMLKIPSIYLNDNEHAKGNYLAFRYATLNLIPEFLESKAINMKWDKRFRLAYYPGIKEGIYLSQSPFISNTKKRNAAFKNIYIRPEPWNAQYYKGESFFLDKLLLEIKSKFKIILLPRDSAQVEYYKTKEFEGIEIPNNPLTLEDIYTNCDLFIGAGGTMTREIAFLGIPTISIYQDKLLAVDQFLIDNKYMHHIKNLDAKILEAVISKQDANEKKTLLFNKGMEAFKLIEKLILQYGNF